MGLPFSQDQFLETFSRYNRAIFPAQFLAAFLCLGLLVACLTRNGARGRIVLFLLAGLWIWNGLVYHIGYFSAINPVARFFGAFFVLQGLLLVWAGARSHSNFAALKGWRGGVGLAMMMYAVAIYPILGWLSGHGYPFTPVLGAAPCPTTIFTLGLLLMAEPPVPRQLFVIPLLWAVVGTSAAFGLGMREDIGLGIAALTMLGILVLSPRPAALPASFSGSMKARGA